MPTIIPNWREVLKRALSIRFTLLATLASAAQGALEYYASGQPSWLIILVTLASLGSAASRILDQGGLTEVSDAA